MAETNYIQEIQGLLAELQQISIAAMAQTGVKKSSDLSKSVKYSLTKDGIQMKALEYYPFVSEGHVVKRRSRVAKVPIDALIEWIKDRGLVPNGGKTINQLAFAIQTAIYQRGIKGKVKTKGRGFADVVANDVADYTAEELANYLANEIANELVEAFAPVAV